MPQYPSREEFREVAQEEAKIRVSALLQVFALPQVDEEQIHQLRALFNNDRVRKAPCLSGSHPRSA